MGLARSCFAWAAVCRWKAVETPEALSPHGKIDIANAKVVYGSLSRSRGDQECRFRDSAGIPLLFIEEFEVVIMIELVTEEMHGSD